MQLSTNAHLVGRYCCLKSTGGWLRLEEANHSGRIQLAESPEQKPAQTTGRWDGRFTDGTFAGTWSSPDGKRKLPFSLRQAAPPPPQSPSALAKPKLSASAAPQTTHAPAVSKSWRPAVDRELEEARRRFCYEGQAINVPFVPLVTTGWDKQPRKDHPVSWEKNQAYHQQAIFPSRAELQEIASHLERDLAFVGKHSDCCAANTVIVYAWNEYDEGGWLAPTWTPSGQADTTRLSAVGALLSRRGARPGPGMRLQNEDLHRAMLHHDRHSPSLTHGCVVP